MKDELIKNPLQMKPHIVLLGAGASLAAFMNGDRNGKRLPVMNDLVQVLGLEQHLLDSGIDPSGNFEEIYANINDIDFKKMLEDKIFKYFASLQLPDEVTLYDELLVSLRDKDSIFTFNWDPFLFDAYMRNCGQGISLPEIFFLHGNVRLAACSKHYKFRYISGLCEECGNLLQPVPLLYPIEKKDYQNQPHYTKGSWEEAQSRFADAFTITIFGYGAPSSDIEAVELLHKAWLKESERKMEHIEIIDTAEHDVLTQRWGAFAPTHHYHIVKNFRDSRLWKWPRRTSESIWYPMSQAIPCEEFPLPEISDHAKLLEYIRSISIYESRE